MIQVKRICSTGWQRDNMSIEDRINMFLRDNITNASQIVDIKMDFGSAPEADYVVTYIFYETNACEK